ncbi:right-handed parallel beta-helix repeat-containing protein [Paenibacillus sedimenti]|uniref:Right-handed parallel beta-helix repeat-containing protein n=1 Tax=Paenibacillus sedimenti TaxID=2770274 RepID=A0A926QKX2_9BACL|nr:right-handed parallel beta-helix repeat-containing protein [Paenibacillus sedimenti]MBD0382243.1 right-handed parallel beta-helix repeat-containing protein [Paenibacillus sedimenti]
MSEISPASSSPISRRKLLSSLGAAGFALAAGGLLSDGTAQAAPSSSILFNVKDYGARGNGRFDEDDAPFIQSALDSASVSGGIVFIPAGVYYLRMPLRVNSNTTLMGSGSNSILRSAMNKFGIINLSAVNHVHIHHLSLQGQGTFGTSYVPRIESGISLIKASDIRITDCVFTMIDNGVTSMDSSRVIVESCTFDKIIGTLDYDTQGYGIWCSNASDHNIHQNQFSMLFQSCISLTTGSSNSVIARNRMQKCYQSGIELISLPTEAPCKNNTISDNILEGFVNTSGKSGYTHGIRIKGNCASNIISGNTLTDIDDFAIKCESKGDKEKERPRYNTFANNQIRDIRNTGIVLVNSYDNRISDNSVRDCKADGISLSSDGKEKGSSCNNNHIAGNSLVRCDKSPIRISDANCQDIVVYGNIGAGNGDKIIDKGKNTITSSL